MKKFLFAATTFACLMSAGVPASANTYAECRAGAENYASYFGEPGSEAYDSAYDTYWAPCIEIANGGGGGGGGFPPGGVPILPPQHCVTGTRICDK